MSSAYCHVERILSFRAQREISTIIKRSLVALLLEMTEIDFLQTINSLLLQKLDFADLCKKYLLTFVAYALQIENEIRNRKDGCF
jgi:hypothetical protein